MIRGTLLNSVHDPAEQAAVQRRLQRRIIFDALCIISFGAFVACVIGVDGMTWQYYAGLAQFGSLLLIFSIIRAVNMARVFKRSLRRTYQWINVVQKFDSIAQCINAVITCTIYNEWKFINEVITQENVYVFGICIAWIIFIYLISIAILGGINLIVILL